MRAGEGVGVHPSGVPHASAVTDAMYVRSPCLWPVPNIDNKARRLSRRAPHTAVCCRRGTGRGRRPRQRSLKKTSRICDLCRRATRGRPQRAGGRQTGSKTRTVTGPFGWSVLVRLRVCVPSCLRSCVRFVVCSRVSCPGLRFEITFRLCLNYSTVRRLQPPTGGRSVAPWLDQLARSLLGKGHR